MRHTVIALLILILALPTLPAADAPEKKDRANPGSEKPLPEERDAVQHLLEQAAQKSRQAQERIGNKDVGDQTQQLQRDVIAGLDALIGEAGKAQGTQGGEGAGRGRRGRGSQVVRGQEPGPGMVQGGQATNGPSNQGGMGSGGPSEEAARLAEVYKSIWGHLPEILRPQVDAYARGQFMDKYRDQLERYYKAIAQKGRRGD